jgi:hypothetical protein
MQALPGMLLPWNHHVWAIGSDGVLIDPTVCELFPEQFLDLYEPLALLEQLQPEILWVSFSQDAVLSHLRPLAIPNADPFVPLDGEGQLLYLPGRVHRSKGQRWQRLGKKSKGPMNFSPADLERALLQFHADRRFSRPRHGFARGEA